MSEELTKTAEEATIRTPNAEEQAKEENTITGNDPAAPQASQPKTAPAPQIIRPVPDTRSYELLEEIVKNQKKTARRQRGIMYAMFGIFAVVLVSACILVPKATKLMNDAENAVQNIDTLSVQMQGAVEQINVAVESVNTVVVDNTQDISDALQNINNVDFETLNQAITDLADTVEPMARFFKLLG